MVREIDDYLLLTRDSSKAQRFLRLFIRGFPNYSMTVKKKKTLTNFPFYSSSFSSSSSSSSSPLAESSSESSRANSALENSSTGSARTSPVIMTSLDCSNKKDTRSSKRDACSIHKSSCSSITDSCSINGSSSCSSQRDGSSSRDNGRDANSNSESSWFPWCGFLFHESTLEVRFDLSRYKGYYGVKEMKKSVSLSYDNKTRWTIKDIKVWCLWNSYEKCNTIRATCGLAGTCLFTDDSFVIPVQI